MNKLTQLLQENFGDKCKYNTEENTIYYSPEVDLNELFKVIVGYKVYVQLNLL